MSYAAQNKQALVVEGGAMRSIYSAGVLDGFLDAGFNPFSLYVGVSAGAFNLATFLTGRKGDSLEIFLQAAKNKKFINYPRFLLGGDLLDIDWLEDLVRESVNLDKYHLTTGDRHFDICVTEVMSGKARYVRINPDNLMQVLKATTALPVIYRKFPEIDNQAMSDGGIADGIPVQRAIENGANRIMVIRSRHYNYVKRDTVWHKYLRWKIRQYPALAMRMKQRVRQFETTLTVLRNPPAGIKVLEICPPASFKMGRFRRNQNTLKAGYDIGYQQSMDIMKSWKQACTDPITNTSMNMP